MRFKQLSDTTSHSKLLKTDEGVPYEHNIIGFNGQLAPKKSG